MPDLQYPVTIVNSLSTIILNAIAGMSDETEIRFSVLYCVSGCYAEVHISWEILYLG